MVRILDFEKIRNFYIKDLENNFLPFWRNAIDEKYGGVFTCFVNDGSQLSSERKYIWSQGRFLWLGSNLLIHQSKGDIELARGWKESVEKTYDFLQKNTLMANGHAVFALEKNGDKIDDQLDTSIFADCFYVLGCNSYAFFKKDIQIFDEALKSYDLIKRRIADNTFRSEPYPIPIGYRSHSIPMILMNVAEELHKTAELINHQRTSELEEDLKVFLNEIINVLSDDTRIKEMHSDDSHTKDTLLARHVNPGHTLESIWFMIHAIERIDSIKKSEYLNRLIKIADNTLNIGWDGEYGGLLRFVDLDGGPPKGIAGDSPYELMIQDSWDTKLWWPHAESLYTTLLLFEKTKDEKWLEWYKKIEEYVFKTFPNPDKEVGEWIQIRERNGAPLEKVVALPVKDPFHIIRSYLLIISLMERMEINAFRK